MRKTAIIVFAILLSVVISTSAEVAEWVCPECGTESTTNFCMQCGTERPLIVCPECGEEYIADSKVLFCGHCGAKLPEYKSRKAIEQEQKQNYELGIEKQNTGDLFKAHEAFTLAGNYLDAEERLMDVKRLLSDQYWEEGKKDESWALLAEVMAYKQAKFNEENPDADHKFNEKRVNVRVSSLSWERNISIEEHKEFRESGWSLPDGAEQTDIKSELHHYDQVLDHYEDKEEQRSRQVLDHYETYYTYSDNGNGTYAEVSHERPVYETEYYTETVKTPVYNSVPVYQDKYYYNIRRWVHSRDLTTAGDDHNPYWHELDLKENEREGNRTEIYRFTACSSEDESGIVSYQLAEKDWLQIQIGDVLGINSQLSGADPYVADSKGNRLFNIIKE